MQSRGRRRDVRGQGARLLGARLDPLPARQARDRERGLHHLPVPRRVRGRADRGAAARPRPERHLPPDGVDATTSSRSARGRTSRRRPIPARAGHFPQHAAHPRRRQPARSRPVPAPPLRRADRRSRSRSSRRSSRSVIGVLMGLLAGYFRGWVDTVVSRLTEMVMVFPIAALHHRRCGSTVGEHAERRSPSASWPGACSRSSSSSRSSAGSTRRASSAASCCRCARRSSSRRRG